MTIKSKFKPLKLPVIGKARMMQIAPDFKTKAFYGKKFVDISLSQFRGNYVVLFFYTCDFTQIS